MYAIIMVNLINDMYCYVTLILELLVTDLGWGGVGWGEGNVPVL